MEIACIDIKMKRLLQISVICLIILEVLGKNSIFLTDQNCPENMYRYYPDPKSGDEWFCECIQTFLYYPKEDTCYDAYRQGPCPSGYFLVLPPGETIAKCVRNPCRIDGIVPFRNKCYFLWKTGPPCDSNTTYFGVEERNFELTCDEIGYKGNPDRLITSKSCPENSIFRPDYKTDTSFTCNCKYGFIHIQKNNSCLEVYRQGSCPPQHYLVVSQREKEPRCEKNPCFEDGLVPFRGGCHVLGKSGPPCENNLTHLLVNMKTFQLQCIYVPPQGHGGGGIINAPPKACPEGSRRIATGFCKRVFE